MGCWNATCGISNLPIMDGDSVMLVIIQPTLFEEVVIGGDGYCESTNYFEPATLPLYGEYEEYGRLYTYDSPFKDEIIEHIRYNFDNMVYNCSKEDFDVSTLTVEMFIELVKDGYVYIATPKRPLGVVMLHRDVIDELIVDLVEDDSFVCSRIERSYSNCMERLIDVFSRYKESIELKEDFMKYNRLLVGTEFNFARCLTWFMVHCVLKNKDVSTQLKDDVFKIAYVDKLMSRLRKSWMPQSGLGSQEYVNSSYSVLSSFILRKITEEKERYED